MFSSPPYVRHPGPATKSSWRLTGGAFEVALSVPLLAEYDDVLLRPSSGIPMPRQAVEAIIRRIAQISHKQPIYFLWRPLLPDPKNDMVLELAIASDATHIVTFNHKDFIPVSQLGISVINPSTFLRLLP